MPTPISLSPISLSNMDRGVTGVSRKVPLNLVVDAEVAINKLGDLSRFPAVALPARIAGDFTSQLDVVARRIPLNQLIGKGADTILAVHSTQPDGEEHMRLYDSSNKCISDGYKEDGMTTFAFGAMLGHVPSITVVKGTD